MVSKKLKDTLERLEREKKDLKRARTFIPSKLSVSQKKVAKYNLSERIEDISKKQKEAKEEEKEFEKKRSKFLKKIEKIARTKVTSRRILKKGKMSVHIPEFKAPSILGDTNRFFKNEWEETKRSMFS